MNRSGRAADKVSQRSRSEIKGSKIDRREGMRKTFDMNHPRNNRSHETRGSFYAFSVASQNSSGDLKSEIAAFFRE
jgi:hypothetical protein